MKSGRSNANPAREENPRLRFAKAEIARVLAALEAVDAADFNHAMRVLHLEDQLADANDLAAEWRRKYEALKQVAAAGKKP